MLALIALFHGSHKCIAQASNIEFKTPRELTIIGINTIWASLNYAAILHQPKIPTSGNNFLITPIDKLAIYSIKKPVARISDVTLGLTYLAATIPILYTQRSDKLAHIALMVQSASLTANLTQTVKILSKRNRPYTYADQFQYSKKGDIWSFFSGHSAQAAAVFTTTYLLYKEYKINNLNTKPFVIGAGILGLGTAALRIAAGKHFPSDVVIGMLAGAGIAWINFKIHEN